MNHKTRQRGGLHEVVREWQPGDEETLARFPTSQQAAVYATQLNSAVGPVPRRYLDPAARDGWTEAERSTLSAEKAARLTKRREDEAARQSQREKEAADEAANEAERVALAAVADAEDAEARRAEGRTG
jgi:hypothetical protein